MKKIHRSWLIFIGCFLFSFIGFGLVVNTPGLYFQSLRQEFGISQASVSLMITIQQMCSALTLLVAGRVIERVNARLLMGLCALTFGGGFLICSFLPSITFFYVVWGLMGVAQAFCLTLGIPVFLGNWFQKKYGMVMGIALGVSAIGGAIFNPIISQIITEFGWRQAYLTSGLLTLAILLPVALIVFKLKPTGDERPYGYEEKTLAQSEAEIAEPLANKKYYQHPAFFLFLITIVLLNFVNGFVQHVSSHIINIGFTLVFGASVISAIMIGASIGKILVGALLDKFKYINVILIFTAFSTFGWLGLTYFTADRLLISSSFLLGLGQGIVLVAVPFLVRKVFGGENYSQVFSLLSMFGAFAQALSVSAAGAIFDVFNNYRLQFTGASLFFLISFSCFLLLGRLNAKQLIDEQ